VTFCRCISVPRQPNYRYSVPESNQTSFLTFKKKTNQPRPPIEGKVFCCCSVNGEDLCPTGLLVAPNSWIPVSFSVCSVNGEDCGPTGLLVPPNVRAVLQLAGKTTQVISTPFFTSYRIGRLFFLLWRRLRVINIGVASGFYPSIKPVRLNWTKNGIAVPYYGS
jgi:hypothetical protein